jgi:hypothetical protein
VTASAPLGKAGPGRVAAVLAEAARRSAEAHAVTAAAQALAAGTAESAESAATCWEAADARPTSPARRPKNALALQANGPEPERWLTGISAGPAAAGRGPG